MKIFWHILIEHLTEWPGQNSLKSILASFSLIAVRNPDWWWVLQKRWKKKKVCAGRIIITLKYPPYYYSRKYLPSTPPFLLSFVPKNTPHHRQDFSRMRFQTCVLNMTDVAIVQPCGQSNLRSGLAFMGSNSLFFHFESKYFGRVFMDFDTDNLGLDKAR